MNKNTPFSQQLVYLGRGTLNDELTEAMGELVKAVRSTGKKGRLTLTLDVAMLDRANEDAVRISPTVALKAPEHPRPDTIMFSRADGDLLRTDPDQPNRVLEKVDTPAKGDLVQVDQQLTTLKKVS